MNIILIISDTLRRGHLGCYGNTWIRTPNLDRFAKESVVFDQAYEASFPTRPTRAGHFTGKLTLTHPMMLGQQGHDRQRHFAGFRANFRVRMRLTSLAETRQAFSPLIMIPLTK